MNLPRSRSDSVYWVLVIYTLGWLVSRMVADANLDPAGNMLENFAWGEYVTWGTSKHPPLMVWVTSVWFTIFPNYDAFYHLLAYLVSAIGLLGVYHLAVAVRLAPFAFSVTILLSIALPYSTLAAKFNANTVLLAVWPWVVWCWVVVIRNPSLLLSALLGFLAALAMLGKYYSGVLLLSLGFATLLDPAGRRWLFSRYSLITITIGALALAPHVLWLIHHDFPTLSYLEGKGGEDVDMNGLFRFAVAPFVFWLIPWCLVAWMFTAPGPAATRFKQWLNNLIFAWQPSVEHRTVTLLVVLPWLFSVILGAVGFVDLRSHWAIPIGFAYPLLWIANLSDRQVISVKRIVGFSRRAFFSWMALVVLLSPVYAWQQGQVGNDNYYRPRADLAGTLIDLWQEQAPGRTLSWTAGHWTESTVVSFYADSSVRAIHGLPGDYPSYLYEQDDWKSQSGLLLCPVSPYRMDAVGCSDHVRAWFDKHGVNVSAAQVELKRSGLRFPLDKPYVYEVFFYLPSKD